MRFTLPR